MRRTSRNHALLKLSLIVAVVALAASACSSAGFEGDEATNLAQDRGVVEEFAVFSETPAGDDVASELASEVASADKIGAGSEAPRALRVSGLGRDIIFTADLTVAVNDVTAAAEEATRLIQGLGGFLFGERSVGSPEPRSVLTFKVQPEDFSTALDRLGAIGDVRSQNVLADDVTERVVDTQSRINTATASVERLRALLDQATDMKSIVDLENELLVRETQLEVLRGQLRTIEDLVSLATIVLNLTEAASRPALTLNVTAYPAHDGGLSCPGSTGLQVETDAHATVCFEITNVGDTLLADFDLRDPVLDIELEKLITVFGDPTRPIEPGESIILATEVAPERSLRTQTTVTAVPVNEEGEAVPGRPAASTVSILIETVDPEGIPGFGAGLEASWQLLIGFSQVLILLAGVLLPFIWVPIIVWLILRARSNRKTGKRADGTTTTASSESG